MDSSIKDEVFNDFKIALDKIDFTNYNPNSIEFVTAMNLGLMWNILNEMMECGETPEIHTVEYKSVDDIDEEINGAKKYLQKYSETGDSKISALRLKPQQMSDSICADWHPSEKTHEKASKQLIDVITKERINY